MALSPGTWLNHYEVLGHLGTGGMGEVYRARDNKLQREVALKVLPKAFAQDPERLGRFRREAQILAQVNHPNIAGIYSVEESGGTHFLVMELAQGETLRDRIKRGPVPIEEALGIAKQIAAGLEAAHEKPIVHRDLKPANVKVTPEGVVKILDFGLARAFAGDSASGDPADSPTLTGMTAPGTILGTAAYMSPEQAKGKTVDKRTDIWALGCVLYEMLAGKRVFDGEDVTEILGAIHHKEPDWMALPEATPTKVRELMRRCLQKDKSRRSRDAAEIQLQIQEALEAPAAEEPKIAKAALPVPLWRRSLPWGVAVVLAAVIGIAAWTLKPTPPTTVTRFTVSLPADVSLQRLRPGAPCPDIAMSPDGRLIAYIGIMETQQQLFLRAVDSLEAAPVSGGAGNAVYSPFFSPDGQWVAFGVDGKLQKAPTSGGAPVTIADVPYCLSFPTWEADDTIYFSLREGTLQVAAAGGEPEPAKQMLPPEDQGSLYLADFLPGGKAALFVRMRLPDFEDSQIVAQRLDTGEQHVLKQTGFSPHYVSTNHLVFARAGTILAVPFDPKRLEVTGGPVTLVEGLARTRTGFSNFVVSPNGSLVYIAGATENPNRTLVWVDRKGTSQPVGAPPEVYSHPQLSPDGRQLAIRVENPKDDIWIYDLGRGALTRLTFEGANARPLWTPDGKRIVYRSERESRNLFWKLADGTGAEEQITSMDSLRINLVSSITPDGKIALFYIRSPQSAGDIWTVPLEGERKPSLFLQTPFDEVSPKISPDGKWVAYISNESGRDEIFVRPFPASTGKWQISTEGGSEPLWARNGRELFYREGDKMMVVDITTAPSFQAGTPRMLFEGNYERRNNATNYDVSPDGQRFLMIKPSEKPAATRMQMNVVLNWFEELKQRVPVK